MREVYHQIVIMGMAQNHECLIDTVCGGFTYFAHLIEVHFGSYEAKVGSMCLLKLIMCNKLVYYKYNNL